MVRDLFQLFLIYFSVVGIYSGMCSYCMLCWLVWYALLEVFVVCKFCCFCTRCAINGVYMMFHRFASVYCVVRDPCTIFPLWCVTVYCIIVIFISYSIFILPYGDRRLRHCLCHFACCYLGMMNLLSCEAWYNPIVWQLIHIQLFIHYARECIYCIYCIWCVDILSHVIDRLPI